ncbi:outer membrane protein assembly factor BamA [Rhodospirillaceae bacterium RKSG073]|nr:outer membrane protein assembly factor BamA [Curvivirga aplysinae]
MKSIFKSSVLSVSLLCGTVLSSSIVNAQSVPLVPPTNSQAEEETVDQNVDGPILQEIVISGLQRIEEETILTYLSLREGKPYTANTVNQSLKKLFATGLFADVSIVQLNQNSLEIKVVENPIINRVAYEGNLRVKDEILESETQLRPRVVYTRTRVQNDVKRILDVYRRRGRYAAKVVPKIIQLDQNRVDLAFEIEEGPDSGVHKISFVGNDYFDDDALASELLTRQTRWYSFLSDADTYDPDKLTFDRELLRRYYLKNGFADFRVVSAVAELSEDRTGFFITFTVEEGDRYSFGEYEISSSLKGVNVESLYEYVDIDVGDWYNANILEDNVDAITEELNRQGFAFVDVYPEINRNTDDDIININFKISEAPKVYVDRIEIRGNVRTKDEVIRREFRLVEGDAFNTSKLRRSRQRITDLGYFKNVEVNNVPGQSPNHTVIQVDVEEQSTGELSLGGGFSTTAGLLAEVAVEERNLLGRGQHLRVATQLGQEESKIDVSFTEPYFLDREGLSAGIDVFLVEEDNQDTSSSDNSEKGFRLRTGYDLTQYWRQNLNFRVANEEVTNVASDASIYVKADEGERTVVSVGHTTAYDRLNSRISPTDGYIFSFSNDFAGLAGDVDYFSSTVRASNYVSFLEEDFVLELSASASNIVGLNDQDVRLNDRWYAGGANFRGFDNAGIGPRDTATSDALGGKNRWLATAELDFPIGVPKEFGLTASVFTDLGSVWSTEENGSNVADDTSIRSSVGVGFNWESPLGPMRFDFAQAIQKEDYDETEIFRFSFGTRF